MDRFALGHNRACVVHFLPCAAQCPAFGWAVYTRYLGEGYLDIKLSPARSLPTSLVVSGTVRRLYISDGAPFNRSSRVTEVIGNVDRAVGS